LHALDIARRIDRHVSELRSNLPTALEERQAK
jgi:hypothetical protein